MEPVAEPRTVPAPRLGDAVLGESGAISAGAPPSREARAVIGPCALMLHSITGGLLGAVIAGPVLDAQPGSVWALWGHGALLVFAAGALTPALRELAGSGRPRRRAAVPLVGGGGRRRPGRGGGPSSCSASRRRC